MNAKITPPLRQEKNLFGGVKRGHGGIYEIFDQNPRRSFSNLCSLHFGGISEGAQMYLGGMRVLRFLSHPVQIGGDDVYVQPACTLCHFEIHEQPPIARVEFRFALNEHLEVGPVAGIVENVP